MDQAVRMADFLFQAMIAFSIVVVIHMIVSWLLQSGCRWLFEERWPW